MSVGVSPVRAHLAASRPEQTKPVYLIRPCLPNENDTLTRITRTETLIDRCTETKTRIRPMEERNVVAIETDLLVCLIVKVE